MIQYEDVRIPIDIALAKSFVNVARKHGNEFIWHMSLTEQREVFVASHSYKCTVAAIIKKHKLKPHRAKNLYVNN